MSFAGALTEIKFAKLERRVFCDKAARNVITDAKKEFKRARRRTARQEIEAALYDIKPDEPTFDTYEEEMARLHWADYTRDPVEERKLNDWARHEENERYLRECEYYDEECDYYDILEEIESAYRGDWQEEVPDVFGDFIEVVTAA